MVKVGPFVRRSLVAAFTAAAVHTVFPDYDAEAGQNYVVGGLTSQPIGHYEFCKVNASECGVKTSNPTLLEMTDAYRHLMGDINARVNRAVQPISDFELYGKEEVWIYPKDKGDCEDYVLEKRRQLHAAGIPLSNLLITVVRKPDGEGHAILTVTSDQGDFILDNLTNEIKSAENTNYKFLKRVSAEHTGRWVELKAGASIETASTAAEAPRTPEFN